MEFKKKFAYDKDLLRSSTRQVMHAPVSMDDGYYNSQYMSYNDNIGQNVNPNNPMMNMSFQQSPVETRQDDQNPNYYQEYCRLFIANVVLTTQMKELVGEKNELMAKLNKLEQRQHEISQKSPSIVDSNEAKKKRERRRACEIDRHYICALEKCQKAYGSEGSLNQHMKNKHPEVILNTDIKHPSNKKNGGDSISPKKSIEQGIH